MVRGSVVKIVANDTSGVFSMRLCGVNIITRWDAVQSNRNPQRMEPAENIYHDDKTHMLYITPKFTPFSGTRDLSQDLHRGHCPPIAYTINLFLHSLFSLVL